MLKLRIALDNKKLGMRAQWTDFFVKFCPRAIKMDCQNNEEVIRDWYGQT